MIKKLFNLFMIVAVLALFLVACTEQKLTLQNQNTSGTKGGSTGINSETKLEASQALKKFNSVDEIIEYINKNSQNGYSSMYYGRSKGGRGIMVDSMETAAVAPMVKSMAESDGAGSSNTASTYSQTNVQVEGVDEADFMKNDDKYIYIISQDKLVIADAYPAQNAKVVSNTELEGRPSDMFVNEDILVVFSVLDGEGQVISEYDFMPRQTYKAMTHAYVYDISDRAKPELVSDYNIAGNYNDARMIGEYVYFITQDYVNLYNGYVDVPVVLSGTTKLIAPDVYYFDNPDQNFVFHTVASFNVNEEDSVQAKTFMMGYSNTLYVSENNIYIAYQKSHPWDYYKDHNEERFYNIVVPLLPGDVQSTINSAKDDSSLSAYARWEKIATAIESMYDNMDKSDREDLQEKIQDAIEEYEAQIEIEMRKTIIQKIAINKGAIEYKAKGEVSGYLLNQFSLDENDGNLRVATTTEIWSRSKNQQYNNVYVLDEDMDVVGKLEELAPDERIYSTRFMGDRLYMVTFKRVDPLFVIDLSDATQPKVLGELKIPGFSDYLHPYDEDHVIGIGKDTADNEWGGVSIKGLKLALFDVTDVTNPKQIAKYNIGTAGTDSEALHEHKAFLFDKDKALLVIPVREVKEQGKYDSRYGYYRQRIWQGAYVFNLNPEDGFELKGKISHNEGDEDQGWYWGSPYAVRRSLFMDDVLYTVSAKKILMNDLDDVEDEINSLELPFKQERYYPVYY